jgi:3-(3-hydroxy-phenyl)propionate hydroxylase
LLDDFTGSRFRLIALDASVDEVSPVWRDLIGRPDGQIVLTGGKGARAAADGRILIVVDPEGALAAWLEPYGSRIVVVRPDHYVFGAAGDWNKANELAAALSSWLA